MINLSSTNLSPLNLGGMNTSEIKLGYPSSGCPVPGLKGLQGLYMGKGLTNEMMSRDPIWRDKSGKGNHIQLKNFGWKLQSGVGMYEHDFSKKWGLFHSANSLLQSTSIVLKSGTGNWGVKIDKGVGNIVNFKAKLIVEGLDKLNDNHLYFGKFDLNPETLKELHEGLNDLDFDIPSSYGWYGFGFKQTIENANVKITLLPYAYENALCFDGVDDYGETIKDLNFTDNYSVVSLVVPFYNNRNNVLFGKDHTKDVYCNFSNQIRYYSVNRSAAILENLLVKEQVRLLVCRRNGSIQEIKDICSNTSKSIVSIPVIENPGKYYLGRSQTVINCGQFAMFAHAIFDHYISDEELQILSDYWKKELPELFPGQAWTVTGKTNSDADRATIKNITGNGNDLVLTNFGYAENSGYGRYYQYFGAYFNLSNTGGELWHLVDDYTIKSNSRNMIDSLAKCHWTTIGIGNQVKLKFKVSGLQDGDMLKFGRQMDYPYSYDKDGIYIIDFSTEPLPYGFSLQSSLEANKPITDVQIEILPFDYEGYLVTDGVDDQITSNNINFGDNWTIVGDWFFMKKEYKACGLVSASNFYVYNNTSNGGIVVYIKRANAPDALHGVTRLKAICSDGRVYDEYWNEIKLNSGTINNVAPIKIGYQNAHHTQMAFKNLGIYNNTIMNKEQCIRSYNYLQTIKNN